MGRKAVTDRCMGAATFRLELDLRLYFVPPMTETGNGIVLTRSLDLPFPPYTGLVVFGRSMDVTEEPTGFHVDDVIWDADRRVFLAHTDAVSQDVSIAEIADEIETWLGLGWRLGSYNEAYRRRTRRRKGEEDDPEFAVAAPDDDDPAEGWQRKSPRDRSREFNAFFRALVRFMVESMNNESVAFAMHTTKRYFSPSELETTQTTPAKRFQQAEEEFDKLTEEEKRAWEERVCRTYPRLDRVFALRQSW